MQSSWFVLIPPATVLLLSFITKKVNEALLTGILISAFLVEHFSPLGTIQLAVQRLWTQCTLPDNLYLFAFLILLGMLIVLISHTGATVAWSNLIRKKIHTRKGVEIACLSLGTFFFMDDYFNSLTVGAVMRKITDSFKIPRVKLAFFINAMAPTLAILVPISSWIAAILGQLSYAGISEQISSNTLILADPFIVYLEIVPYIFYSVIVILSTWFIVLRNISYGPMHVQERIAHETGNLYGGKEPSKTLIKEPDTHNANVIDFIFPIGILLLAIPGSILYAGNYYLLGGSNDFFQALAKASIPRALLFGCAFTLITCIFFFLIRKKFKFSELSIIAVDGFNLMKQSIIVLLLAWTFSSFLQHDLPAGAYLANSFLKALPITLLPFMFFVISIITSTATGSSWGTMAVMIPLAVPMVIQFLHVSTPTSLDSVAILIPIIGAILSGSIAGPHLSPIADNMVMASTSSGSHHLDHVQTQVMYVLPAIIGTGIAFLVIGHLSSHWPATYALIFALLSGLLSSFLLLTIFDRLDRTRIKKS